MRFVELFAGAGGCSLGLERAGLQCVAHAEIHPHARAVLRYQWPAVPLLGDVTTLNGADHPPCDLLAGGSPCQDLSVAGKRAGLEGARSSLFYHQARLWEECGAPYLLWENVAGALSSQHGRDFSTVLSTLVGTPVAVPADGWGRGGVASGPAAVAAWRVFDLRYMGPGGFGPPQRRVRVFVLAARAGAADPAAILALTQGVCGHPDPREAAPQEAALSGVVSRQPLTSGLCGGQIARALTACHTATGRLDPNEQTFVFQARTHNTKLSPRRLMPVEAERLQGWPDDHTATGIDEQGRAYALKDTPRYLLCGNGCGAPHAEWIGRRLMAMNNAPMRGVG